MNAFIFFRAMRRTGHDENNEGNTGLSYSPFQKMVLFVSVTAGNRARQPDLQNFVSLR